MSVIQFIEARERIIIPVVLSIITVILFHGIFKTYAFTDDYDFLLNASHDDFINVFIQGGRPIFGLLMKWLFTTFNTVEEAFKIRLVSLFGSIIFINFFYFFLRKQKLSLILSLFITLLLLCSPSLDIKVIWTLGFTMPYVSVLALLSGIYLCKAANDHPVYIIHAVLLGLVVLLTYQPIYTLSVVPLFIKWANDKFNHKVIIKTLLLHLLVYVLYYVVFKLTLNWFDLPALNRSGLNLNLFERAWWYLTGPAKKALIYNFLFYKRAVLWIIFSLSLFSIGAFIVPIFKRKNVLLHLIYFIAIFFLSMLPNLLSSDDWISYRTMGTLIILVILIIGFSINCIRRNYLRYILFSLIPVIAYANAYYNINKGFIAIQVKEYDCLKQHLESQGLDETHYLFIQPEVNFLDENDLMERVITDEYGRLSTSSNWVPEPMIKLIYKENNKPLPEVTLFEENMKIDSSHTVIDMPDLYLRCKM